MIRNQTKYRILLLIVGFSIIFSCINYFVFYSESISGLYLLFILLLDALQYLLVLLAMHLAYHIYTKRAPLNFQAPKQLIYIFITIFLTGFVCSVILIEIEFFALSYRDEPFYQKDIFVILVYLFFTSWLYLSIQLIYNIRSKKTTNPTFFLSRHSNKQVQIPVDNIKAILIIRGQTAILSEEKLYPIELTLDQITHRLDGRFFRMNRQLITHFSTVESFRSIEGGKIKIIFTIQKIPPEYNIVSRLKASQFRKWMKLHSISTH